MAASPRLRRLVFAPLAAVAGLLILEGLARVAILVGVHALLPPEVVEWVGANHVVFDPELGWRPESRTPTIEGGNFHGNAFEDDSAPLRPGELRGYALGDSQTHGAGVAEDHAWPSATEAVLRADGHDIRVVNLGSSGYRSAQVLRLVETYILPRHPAFLLVDCMVNDSEALPRDYGNQWTWVRRGLFESRLYRLLALGIASARGQNVGPRDSVTIEQPLSHTQGVGGPGNHAAILALARAEKVPVIFVDYPFTGEPIKSLAPASRLPPGAIVAPATAALQATGRPASALFLENNHLSAEGGAVVGAAVAHTLEGALGL